MHKQETPQLHRHDRLKGTERGHNPVWLAARNCLSLRLLRKCDAHDRSDGILPRTRLRFGSGAGGICALPGASGGPPPSGEEVLSPSREEVYPPPIIRHGRARWNAARHTTLCYPGTIALTLWSNSM